MNMNTAITPAMDHLPQRHQTYRYQIYRQQRAGNYSVDLQTYTVTEAIQAFIDTKPAFEGGSTRLASRRTAERLRPSRRRSRATAHPSGMRSGPSGTLKPWSFGKCDGVLHAHACAARLSGGRPTAWPSDRQYALSGNSRTRTQRGGITGRPQGWARASGPRPRRNQHGRFTKVFRFGQ